MILRYPNACVAFALTGNLGPCEYAFKDGNSISDGIIKALVLEIHAAFGGKIVGVLALPLLWVVFESDMVVNGHTLPFIPTQLAEQIKGCWIAARNPCKNNPIKTISLAVQKLGNHFAIVPLVCLPAPPAPGSGTTTALEQQQEGDVAITQGKGPVSAAFWGSKNFLSGPGK